MLARLRFLALYLVCWLAFFAVLRAVFLLAFASRAAGLPIPILLATFVHGIPLDLSAAAYLTALPCLVLQLATSPKGSGRARALILRYSALASVLLTLLACADLGIFDGWGQHIDASVLPYLPSPREAWASAALEPRGLLLILWLLLAVLFLRAGYRVLSPRLAAMPPAGARAVPFLLLAAAALVIPARGGFQLIPVNQSSAYFSPVRFANQAAINVGWNFFDSWRRGLDRRSNPFRFMAMDSARALVAGARRAQPPSEPDATQPLLLKVARPNVLLIVWESFAGRAVGSLGGLSGITPRFDSLARNGLLFRRLYASGDHTERGLAALLSGAPSLPGASILKVPGKAATLPMLSRDLTAAGYHTAFYYGGELAFGNLRSFTREGRFERVVGKSEFPRSAWRSKWGVHDGVVAERVLDELAAAPKPFFATWLTLSSHEPFEVPGPVRVSGRDPESRFLNSLAYSDAVIGELLRRASAEPWWDSTLVIIVADHSKPLVRTDRDAPYKSAESWFHIPMLWTGGALARPGRVDAIGSQTDLAPTLLAALGLPGERSERYRFGRNLLAPGPGFAWYGFDEGFGLVSQRGSLVWELAPRRITSAVGTVSDGELHLGQALLQLGYQDYLDR
jgi:phosphoglycerol transferase MdoB-like AlkP superfamily enzyme